MPTHMMKRWPAPGMFNVLLSHTFVIWREIYGTMGADKDEVKDLQRSTKKEMHAKIQKVTRDVLYVYQLLTKYGVLNFKIDKMPLKGRRRHCHGRSNLKSPIFTIPYDLIFFL